MNENKYYVYEYYITPTNEIFYVGKGCGDRYKTIKGRNKFFLDMYQSHTCDVRLLVTGLSEEEAYFIEYVRIQFLKKYTTNRLTNQTDGGDGTRGFKLSESHKLKIAQATKQRWLDSDWKSKIIQERHNPDSTYQSKEFKQKISKLVQGENNPNYGNHWTNEMKNNLSQKKISNGLHKGVKNGRCKKIQCVETGEVFNYIEEAKEKYNVKCAASFSVALDNPKRTAAGLHWITLNIHKR
jgi:hypothetical protein